MFGDMLQTYLLVIWHVKSFRTLKCTTQTVDVLVIFLTIISVPAF